MQKRIKIFLMILFSRTLFMAQMPSCPSPFIFMDGSTFLQAYDPGQPLSTSNPSNLNIPSLGGNGLTLMTNINGGTVCPTFYTTFSGNYYYWNGTSWINTGHSTGNLSAVNIAGCSSGIYNLVGSTGQVYFYNGTGNGTLLTTLSNFNGGGPYDLVTDCNCNFYALNTTTPNQALTLYNSSGAVISTYTLSGMPNTSGGGGFAIQGNSIFVKNNSSGGFYMGTISGSGVTFTAVSGFNQSPGDFASCPVCSTTPPTLTATASGGTVSCVNPTVNLTANCGSSLSLTYSWTGPGILGAATNSVIVANAAGIYTCVISAGGCPPSQVTVTASVISNVVNVVAVLTPSGNVCVPTSGTQLLKVSHTSTTDLVSWSGSGISPQTGLDSLFVPVPGSYTVTVTDVASACTATGSVNFVTTPTVNLALSSPSMCLQPFNGSPASLTLTPSGAGSYTLYTSTNYSTSSPNGTTMPCVPVLVNGNFSQLATATLVGSNAFCTDTAVTSFSIIPNPTVVLSQTATSVCPGSGKLISASGAAQYLWGGSAGLNTYSGNNVVATPSAAALYSVMGGDNGCQSQTKTVSVTILPLPTVSVSPLTATICLSSTQSFTANGNATSYTWSPQVNITGVSANSAVVTVSPPSTQLITVTGALNSCTNSANALLTIVQPPVLSMALSSHTVCAQNYNNSPNTLTVVPSGAVSYTLVAGTGANVFSANGPVMQISPVTATIGAPAPVTVTLTGESGVCRVSITDNIVVLPNPVISVSPPSASICPGKSQGFSVSGATSFSWLPMPNYTLTSPSTMVANPLLTSFYSVIGNSVGCNSATKNAVLVLLPVPSVSLSPQSSTVCSGNMVAITANGNAAVYSWAPHTFLSSTSGTMVVATPTVTQIYTVTATLNTCTNSAIATVSAIQIPTLTAVASQPTVCTGASTHLNAFGANSFQWFPSQDLNSPSGNQVIATPNSNTTYTVRGYNGICTGSTTLLVQTISRPNMQISAPYNEICPGASVPITVSGAQSYTWLPVNALITTGTNTRIVAMPLETTNYTVYGANSSGSVSCYQLLCYSVVVVPAIKPQVSPNVNLCLGEKTTLYASGGNTYSWSPQAGLNIANASGVVAGPSVTTIYTVEVSSNSFCGKSTTVMVSVNPKPTVFAGRDTVYNLNETILIRAEGTGTLTWISGEDILCKDCPETPVYPSRNSCYIVEARNEFGCKATDNICIDVTEDFSAYIPNAFTPNNDGLNDVFIIYGENISQVSMEIYNRWGQSVFVSNDFRVGWDGTLKGELCPPGVYTYVIKYTGLNRKKYTKTGYVTLNH